MLSATSNSLNNSLNSLGVYYIDCKGEKIRITDSRLLCTLVLVNPNHSSYVGGSVHWEAASSNYPLLLVDGQIEFKMTRDPLYESVIGVNLNPSDNPYRGVVDSALSSAAYPSQLRGLIYATDQVEFKSGDCELVGCLVANQKVKVDGTLLVHYRDIFANDPPPGFQDSMQMRLVSGSIQRVETP